MSHQNLNDLETTCDLCYLLIDLGLMDEKDTIWDSIRVDYELLKFRSFFDLENQQDHNGGRNGIKEWKKQLQLRENYDRTVIRYVLNDDGTARTTCLLATETAVHVGVAKFSNRTFNFSKKKGRAIAQGRAEHANAVFSGETTRRESQEKRREQLSYSITATPENTVEEIISNFFENSES